MFKRYFGSQSYRNPSFELQIEGVDAIPSESSRFNAEVSSASGADKVVRLKPSEEGKYHLVIYTPNGGYVAVESPLGDCRNFACVPAGGHENGIWLIPHGEAVTITSCGYKGRNRYIETFLDGKRDRIEKFEPI